MVTLTLSEALQTRTYWELSRSTDSIKMSERTLNFLASARIWRVYDLIRKTEQDLLNNQDCNRKMLIEIKSNLQAINLSLGLMLAEDLCVALKIPFVSESSASQEIRSLRPVKIPSRKVLIKQRKLINYRLKHYDEILAGTMPHTPPK